MKVDELKVSQTMHDIHITLLNLQTQVNKALEEIQRTLHDGPFYVSVASDRAWAGSDGVYITLGTFDGNDECSERLSHYVLPLPETVEDLVANLAGLVSALSNADTSERGRGHRPRTGVNR